MKCADCHIKSRQKYADEKRKELQDTDKQRIIRPVVIVIHGLEEKTGEWNINIAIREDGNKVVITVADNGLGFDTSKLSADIVNEGHTGLYNIRRRLELRYGTNFLFEIHSEIGKGTEIRIELPKEDGR